MQTQATNAAPAALPTNGLFSRLSQAMAVRRERRALMALDDRMLADVGISRADAYREAHRSLLDVPPSLTHLSTR